MMDGGGFTARYHFVDTLKTKYLLKGFDLLGYDIINIGDEDLCLGTDFIKRMQNEFNFQFISANIYSRKTDELIFPPYVLKTFGGFELFGWHFGGCKIGILGVTGIENLLECTDYEDLDIVVKDGVASIKQLLPELRQKCDFIILLSHLGEQETIKLAHQIDGIDIIICTHAAIPLRKYREIGKTKIFQSGARGKYVGEFAVNLKQGNPLTILQHNLTLLDDKFASSEEMNTLIFEYKKEVQNVAN